MKLSKAIEILTNKSPRGYLAFDQDVADALQLGIEALKRVKFSRNHPSGWELKSLPGETPEEEVKR